MQETEKHEACQRALVSIITPVYNVAPWAARCFDSILAQTWTDWELLLIDDGSTDGSGAICDDYAARDRRIRVFHQENKGVAAARNLGLDNARGDYLLFADPDDWLAPEMAEGMLRAGRGAELVVCGQTNVYARADGTQERQERRIWTGHSAPFESADVYGDVLGYTGMMCNKLFRRDVIGELRLEEGMCYGEDTLFLARVFANVHRAVLVPEPWYFYFRNREGNVVSTPPDARTFQYLDNMARVYRLLRERGEGACGVRRISVAVDETLKKIPFAERRKYRPYIVRCGRTLRDTDSADRRRYARDRRFVPRRRDRLVFFLDTRFPELGLCARAASRLRKGGKA